MLEQLTRLQTLAGGRPRPAVCCRARLTGITLPWATWRDEPQAQALFSLVHGDYLAREIFPAAAVAEGERPQASGEMRLMKAAVLPATPSPPAGLVYRRYDPQIKRTLSFRVADNNAGRRAFLPLDEQPARQCLPGRWPVWAEQENYLRRQLRQTIAIR